MDVNDGYLIESLVRQDEAAFEQVFKTHFKNLHAYACTIIKEEAAAEEVVQQVFFKLWERSKALSISGSVAAYLYRAVYNESLNYLKHQKVKSNYQQYFNHTMKNENDAGKKLSLKELEGKLHKALNELPEQCRTIFQLSRFEELRYREIADQLGISVKTVENQMGKALKILRTKLVEFLPFTVFCLLNFLNAIS
ncbi:MAG: RNA polymerase sigma-70 factor [Flavisolibacter sp.]|nr:RNA polymerase sigma-70 factor [Flavisolibacter sp.]